MLKYSPQYPIIKNPHPAFLPQCQLPIFTSYKTRGKIIFLYKLNFIITNSETKDAAQNDRKHCLTAMRALLYRVWMKTENVFFSGFRKYGYLLFFNTLRTVDADLRFYITNVQDGWRKSAFLTRAFFPRTINLIMHYIEPVSEWSGWRMFIETWPRSELIFRHRASPI